jgi:tRNA threonylcarbamoyladenosine modification (KEOPS) complex  Pcc1 subunit
VSLLWSSHIDKRAAYNHKKGKGTVEKRLIKSLRQLAAPSETGSTVNKMHNHKTVRATYIIDTNNVDYLYRSITPELKTISTAGVRASVRIHKTPKRLVINIKASDITSCRAATNSWLRLALIATDVSELVTNTLEQAHSHFFNLD